MATAAVITTNDLIAAFKKFRITTQSVGESYLKARLGGKVTLTDDQIEDVKWALTKVADEATETQRPPNGFGGVFVLADGTELVMLEETKIDGIVAVVRSGKTVASRARVDSKTVTSLDTGSKARPVMPMIEMIEDDAKGVRTWINDMAQAHKDATAGQQDDNSDLAAAAIIATVDKPAQSTNKKSPSLQQRRTEIEKQPEPQPEPTAAPEADTLAQMANAAAKAAAEFAANKLQNGDDINAAIDALIQCLTALRPTAPKATQARATRTEGKTCKEQVIEYLTENKDGAKINTIAKAIGRYYSQVAASIESPKKEGLVVLENGIAIRLTLVK